MTNIVMLGASGAVGGVAAHSLATAPEVEHITLLNRREIVVLHNEKVTQRVVDVMRAASYAELLPGHDVAVCCMGVGQPSKVSKAQFVAVDKTAVLDFAVACRAAGIARFVLLSAVDANAKSASFYLRTKGELQDAIAALGFVQVSFLQPSMIITPTNRYDWKQGLILATWPTLSCALIGPLKKYRGIAVDTLGRAVAAQALIEGRGIDVLRWSEISALGA